MECNLSVFPAREIIIVLHHLTGKSRLTPQIFRRPEVHFRDYIGILKASSRKHVQE